MTIVLNTIEEKAVLEQISNLIKDDDKEIVNTSDMKMLGRIIVSQDAESQISTKGIAPGVYVLRLINGEKTKTQKIIIE
jgi:hypothetical protein